MTSVRHSWDDYDGVGKVLARRLEAEYETPKVFVEECKRRHGSDMAWVALDLRLLREVDDIGHSTAGRVVDQMVLELHPGYDHE